MRRGVFSAAAQHVCAAALFAGADCPGTASRATAHGRRRADAAGGEVEVELATDGTRAHVDANSRERARERGRGREIERGR